MNTNAERKQVELFSVPTKLPVTERLAPTDAGVYHLFPQIRPTVRVETSDNLTFMRSLPSESMNLIVTSPPYNLGKAYEKKRSQDCYVEEQVATIAEAVRLLHPNGSICWQVGNYVEDGEIVPLDILLYSKFKDFGLKLRNRIIWTFGHGLHCQKRFSGRHETILWFTKSDDYVFNLDPIRVPAKYPNKKHFKGSKRGELSGNPLGKNPSDVWDIPNVKANHVEKTDHPCQFPIGLVERLILALTNPSDNVIDPYVGVGSSAIAAIKNNRNAYGCDIMPEYVQIANRRIEEFFAGTLRTRPMNKPVYEPLIAGDWNMRFVEAYSHHNGESEWKKRELFDWLTDAFEAPAILIEKKCTAAIRGHIRSLFTTEGWSDEVRINPNFDLTVFSIKDDVAFQLQTGNISRALYDLVKLQYLYATDRVEVGALAVPSNSAAARIASNVANFNRVMNELELFDRVISMPILLISFE